MVEVPYEEYILTTEELEMLRGKEEHIYETYWEMMCYYRTRANLTGTRSQGIGHKI